MQALFNPPTYCRHSHKEMCMKTNGAVKVSEGAKDADGVTDYALEVAIIALVQENDESVLNAIFEKYQVDIARWDVATVAAEIESALKIQEDLEHQAKARLIADKKEARREKFDKLKANIKEKFSKKN